MNNTYPIDRNPQPCDPYDDEIELMDLLKILWKWKYLILIGTLICAGAAGVISLNMTKVYAITTVLQPGMLKVTEDGKIISIDSPKNIKAVIETGAFKKHLRKEMNNVHKEMAVPGNIHRNIFFWLNPKLLPGQNHTSL